MSNFKISGSDPTDVIVGSNNARVVGLQDDVVWSKFDVPSETPLSMPANGVTGFIYTINPTASNTSISRVIETVTLDMATYKIVTTINLERTLNYPVAILTWRVMMEYVDNTNNNPFIIFTYNDCSVNEAPMYEQGGQIFTDKVIELDIGDSFSDHESNMSFKFRNTNNNVYYSKVSNFADFNRVSSFINGYPKLTWGNERFRSINNLSMKVATLS